MIDFNHPNTYEHIQFFQDNFPFGAYTIPNSTTLPHWHTHTEMVCTLKGTTYVYINGQQHTCPEGEIQLIPANSLHGIVPKGHSIYTAIVIGDELLTSLYTDFHLAPILKSYENNPFTHPLHISTSDDAYLMLHSTFQRITQEHSEKKDHYQALIKLELCRFFSLLKRNYTQPEFPPHLQTSSQTNYIKNAIEYLTLHFTEKITIAHMCHITNLSEQHFSRIFKAHTGKTFVEYLTLFRLEQAQKLLIHSNLPITQIPEVTGFCNANYFSRIYKKRYGQPPSKTRKACHISPIST